MAGDGKCVPCPPERVSEPQSPSTALHTRRGKRKEPAGPAPPRPRTRSMEGRGQAALASHPCPRAAFWGRGSTRSSVHGTKGADVFQGVSGLTSPQTVQLYRNPSRQESAHGLVWAG